MGVRYAAAWKTMSTRGSGKDPALAPKFIRFNGHPVSQAVSIMAQRGAVQYVVDADVLLSPTWSTPFSAEFRAVPAKRALQGTLRQVGLTMMQNPTNNVYRIAFPSQ